MSLVEYSSLCPEVREEEDLSVPEMAKLVEVSDDAYCKWEQGKSKPTAKNFIDILNVRAKRRGMNLRGLLPFLR